MALYRTSDEPTHVIELHRGTSPSSIGLELAEWLSEHSLDEPTWVAMEDAGLDGDDPDVWGLVRELDEASDGNPIATIAIGPAIPAA